MFVEVRPDGSNEETIINLEQVVRADYESRSRTQASVTLSFTNGETLSLEEEEGRKVIDALKSRLYA